MDNKRRLSPITPLVGPGEDARDCRCDHQPVTDTRMPPAAGASQAKSVDPTTTDVAATARSCRFCARGRRGRQANGTAGLPQFTTQSDRPVMSVFRHTTDMRAGGSRARFLSMAQIMMAAARLFFSRPLQLRMPTTKLQRLAPVVPPDGTAVSRSAPRIWHLRPGRANPLRCRLRPAFGEARLYRRRT